MRLGLNFRCIAVAGFAISTLLLTACGGGGGGNSGSSSGTTLFFANAISDSSSINFSDNDAVVAGQISYLNSSSTFRPVASQDSDITITENGQNQSLDSVAQVLASGSDYAIVALGQENFGAETLKSPQVLIVPVSRSVPNGSKAQLYIVNAYEAASGFPTPSIDFTNPGNNPTFSSKGIAPGNAASLLVDTGAQDFLVRQSGSQGNIVEKTLTLASGSIYLVVVSGVDGASGTQAPSITQFTLPSK